MRWLAALDYQIGKCLERLNISLQCRSLQGCRLPNHVRAVRMVRDVAMPLHRLFVFGGCAVVSLLGCLHLLQQRLLELLATHLRER